MKKSGNNISCESTSYINDTRSHPSVISFNGRRWVQTLRVQVSSLDISVTFKTTSAISHKHRLPNWQQTIKVNAFTICPLDSFTATEVVCCDRGLQEHKSGETTHFVMIKSDRFQQYILLLTYGHLTCKECLLSSFHDHGTCNL